MRLLVISMLFLNLGMTLGADILNSDSHGIEGIESTHIANGVHATLSSACDSQDFTSKDCFDPCHAGGSHFGHCSFVFKSLAATDYPNFEDQLLGVTSEDGLKEVYLEGHRRPPKHS